MADPRDTPAMRQFARFKARHPGCILLFRIGDFYETFDFTQNPDYHPNLTS